MAQAKLLTIIAESALRRRLVDDILRLGATGFTESEVRGQGSRGRRTSDLEGQNVRFEIVASQATVDGILAHINQHYFENYAVIAYVVDTFVLRGEKYT